MHSITLLVSRTDLARTPDLNATPCVPNSFDINNPFAACLQEIDVKEETDAIESLQNRSGGVSPLPNDISQQHEHIHITESPDSTDERPNDETKEDQNDGALPPIPPSADPHAHVLLKHGYVKGKKLAETLQGAVYEVTSKTDGATYVVKQTNKRLHRRGVTIQKGKQYAVKEDIINERRIMERLTKLNGPRFMTRFVDFVESVCSPFLTIGEPVHLTPAFDIYSTKTTIWFKSMVCNCVSCYLICCYNLSLPMYV